MKNLYRLLFLCALLGMSQARAQVNLYANADFFTTGNGHPLLTNCAFQGTRIWTDTTYSSYLWSTGDTDYDTQLSSLSSYDTVWVWVTTGGGGTDSAFVVIQSDLAQNQNTGYPLNGSTFLSLCPGETEDLCTHDQQGVVTWSGPGQWCDGLLEICCIPVSSSGYYNFTRYDANNGCTYLGGVLIDINPVAAPSPQSITVSGDTMYATPCAGCQYQWLDNTGSPISGANLSYHAPGVSGTYSVVATTSDDFGNICGTETSAAYTLIVTAVDEALSGGIAIRYEAGVKRLRFTGLRAGDRLLLTDLQGRVLRRQSATGPESFMDMETLPSGLYIARVAGDSRALSYRFMR